MPRSRTTFDNPAEAAAHGRLGAIGKAAGEAAKKAAREAAREAAGLPPDGPAGDPAAPPPKAATAETVAQHATAAATAAVARQFPPACRIEIERMAPAWCRGYLETTDAEALRGMGLREYLRENWGGERYKLTVRENDDPSSPVLWSAADVQIAGRPRHYGQDLAPPNPLPAAVLLPPAPPAAPPAVDPSVRELTQVVASLARGQAAILDHLQHGSAAAAPPQATGPASAAPQQPLLDAIRQAREVNEALEGLRPPPIDNPEREPPEEGMSAFSRDLGQEFIRRGMDEWFPPKGERRQQQQATDAAGGNGGNGKPKFTKPTQVKPPPAKGTPPATPPQAKRL